MIRFDGMIARRALSTLATMALSLVALCASASAPPDEWWNTTYPYRQQISITVTDADLVTGHSVRLAFNHGAEVNAGRSLASGDDVRIVRWNGSAWQELHRVLDAQSSWNTASTVLWFSTAADVPKDVIDTDYYLYYGNTSPDAPLENGERVFLLYDSFSDRSLDPSRWTSVGLPSVSAGVLTLPVGASIRSRNRFQEGTIWEARIQIPAALPSGGTLRYYLWLGTQNTNAIGPAVGFQAEPADYLVRSFSAASHVEARITNNDAASWQTYGFIRNGSPVRFLLDGSQIATLATLSWGPSLYAYAENDANGGREQRYDWVRIRRYRAQEPSVGLGAREQYGPPGASSKLVVQHDNYGIHCAPEAITIYARDAANNPNTAYNGQIRLDTGTGRGTWALSSGSGSFSDGAADDGLATYTWPLGQSVATFLLTYKEGATPIDVDVYQISDPTIRDDDTEGLLSFTQSGFTVTSSVLNNPASIAPFASPQTAGRTFAIHITAYGQTASDPVCGVIESYDGNKQLQFWSSYVNPTSGTRTLDLSGSAVSPNGSIAATEAGASNRTVTFDSGKAVVTAKYKDAGKISINMKDVSSNPELVGGARGGTGDIVIKPATLVLENIRRTDTFAANPAAADANGSVFITAGAPFAATVIARDAEGSVTPNFGRESPLQRVLLPTNVVAPTGPGVQNPDIETSGFLTYSGGASTAVDLKWPEVGIVRITPRVDNYLASGSDVVGTETGNIGRFVPADLRLSIDIPPVFETACSSGPLGFTYVGQPFAFSVTPVVRVTAVNAAGTRTQNYREAFFKVTNAALDPLSWRTYSEASGAPIAGAPSQAVDPTITSLNDGTGLLAYSSGSGLKITRSTPIAPFSAQISLRINVRDADGIASSDANFIVSSDPLLPVIPFSATSEFRYGRLAFRNSLGSELIDLPTPLRTEYFVTSATGFAVNALDACTTNIPVSLTGTPDTCIRDIGEPGNSGSGCTAPSVAPFRATAAAGDFNLVLAAPGPGQHGVLTLQATAPEWLTFDWNTSMAGEEHPTGTATFGVFQGNSRRIDQRERF